MVVKGVVVGERGSLLLVKQKLTIFLFLKGIIRYYFTESVIQKRV